MKTAKELAKIAIDALEEKKAEDIHIIDISDISTIADYFIIANGTNRSQIQALADYVEREADYPGRATIFPLTVIRFVVIYYENKRNTPYTFPII